MNTEEVLRDRLSDIVCGLEPSGVTFEEVTETARRIRRRQRSLLGAVGVVVTAVIVGVTAAVVPGGQRGATPTPIPASTKTSEQLLAVVKPVVEKVLASYKIAPVTVTAAAGPLVTTYDPTVTVAAGPVIANKTGIPAVRQTFQPLDISIAQHAYAIDPAEALRPTVNSSPVLPEPSTASGTWSGGIRYASVGNSGGHSVRAELPDDVTVLGLASEITTGFSNGRLTVEPNPLAGVTEAVVKAIAQGLPALPHLPVPPQLPWVIGPNDAALAALQTAAAETPDVAATANILYFKAKVVDTRNQNDIEEIWLRRDDQPGAYFASGVQFGKVHGNYSGGNVWQGGIGTDYLDWNGLKNFPTDVAGLERLLYATYGETRPSPSSLLSSFEALVQESPASPRLQASLAVLAGRLPGTTVTPHATDPLGRHAVAIYMGGVTRTRLFFSSATGTFLASEELTKTGAVLQYRAVTQVASVPATRIRPDGTTPQPLKKK